MEQHLWLIALGVVLGALGTLIGAGGGFILMPILLLIYPQESTQTVTAISLAVVFFNALSGSYAYARMRRIDYRSGLMFASATIPGAIIGAVSTSYIPRRTFDGVFGVLLIVGAAYLIFRGKETDAPRPKGGRHLSTRTVVDKTGTSHTYSFDLRIGMVISVFVGYLSSLLGIGGGIVHVPALVRVLGFPVHIATATSHFILAIMALTGTLVHVFSGSFSHGGFYRTLYLSIGVLIGAQAGAWISPRVQGRMIITGLALALGLVGVRIFMLAFSS